MLKSSHLPRSRATASRLPARHAPYLSTFGDVASTRQASPDSKAHPRDLNYPSFTLPSPTPAALSIDTNPPSQSSATMSTRSSNRGSRKPIPQNTTIIEGTPEPRSAPAPVVVTESKPTSIAAAQFPAEIVAAVWDKYVTATPQRVKLIDVFMVFLMVVGVVQFVYCVIVGNYVSDSWSLVFFQKKTSWRGDWKDGIDGIRDTWCGMRDVC